MKKTSLLLYLAFSFCGSISFAQQALTPEVLQTLKESYSHDDAHKAIRNADKCQLHQKAHGQQ